MTDKTRDDTHRQPEQQQQDGPRGGDGMKGHLSPQIDEGGAGEAGEQIAQDREQSSGQGSGQS